MIKYLFSVFLKYFSKIMFGAFTLIGILFMIIEAIRFLNYIPNKDSIFYDLLEFQFSDLLVAALVSFILCMLFLAICIVFMSIVYNRMAPQKFRSFGRIVMSVLTALFFTCTLMFWLDEHGFTIATSIISFFALLFPLTKDIWDK